MTRPNEFYETPIGCTAALLANRMVRPFFQATGSIVLDPCSGDNAILSVVGELFPGSELWTNDIDPARRAKLQADATTADGWEEILGYYGGRPTWIITNPPWSLAHLIIPHALEWARAGVAFHLPLRFQEPTKERADVLIKHPWSLQITFGQPRPSYTEDGGTDSATSFWAVWFKNRRPMELYYVTDPEHRWTDYDRDRFVGRSGIWHGKQIH